MATERINQPVDRVITAVLDINLYDQLFEQYSQYMDTDAAVRLARQISNESFRANGQQFGTPVFKSELR